MLGRLGVAKYHGFMKKAYTRNKGNLRVYFKGKNYIINHEGALPEFGGQILCL